jgi:triosephosphate isomerase
VKLIRNINQDVQILTGAGISYADDVDAALKLGTIGVLVASAVTKSRDPKSVLSSFAEAMVNHTQEK